MNNRTYNKTLKGLKVIKNKSLGKMNLRDFQRISSLSRMPFPIIIQENLRKDLRIQEEKNKTRIITISI